MDCLDIYLLSLVFENVSVKQVVGNGHLFQNHLNVPLTLKILGNTISVVFTSLTMNE